MITVTYASIDHYSQSRSFKEIEAARSYAAHWIGACPSVGVGYAVSDDGIGKITVKGCTLAALFPATEAPTGFAGDAIDEQAAYEEAERRARNEPDEEPKPYRITGCRCCDEQLYRVGCDCGAETMNLPF